MFDILRQTIMVTTLVLIMMLLTELIQLGTKGEIGRKLTRSNLRQLIFSALLGLVPGCIGGFAVVSMFTHNLINFGALFACMVASTGDESFVIISLMPATAILLNIVLFLLAIAGGWLVNLIFPNYKVHFQGKTHLEIHGHEKELFSLSPSQILPHIKKLSLMRSFLLAGILIFLFGIVSGLFDYHTLTLGKTLHNAPSKGDPENILFVVLSAGVFYILLVAKEHFLKEHLWKHIISRHFLRIFLWTFGALAGVHLLLHSVDLYPWLERNRLYVIFLAILIGLIPESGPHLIFVTLFFTGLFPLSILMANSIVQDGHISLPLLAESRKSFILIKAMKGLIGIAVGISGYLIGW